MSTPGPDEGTREPLKHRFEFLLFRVVRGGMSLLPEPIAVRLGAWMGGFAGSVLRIRRKEVDQHLEWAFPEMSASERARLARRSYRHLGREATVLFRFDRWSREDILERIEIVGLDALVKALNPGQGALLLSGHLGNWEVGGAALAVRGIPVVAVAKGMANRRFERDLFAARERLGLGVMEMGDASRQVLRSLRGGWVVAIAGDQNAHRNGVFVPFFGRPAATARGAAMFAVRTGAPVFVGFSTREPGWGQRYTFRIEPLVFEPTGDLEADVVAFTAAYIAHVEAAVLAHPDQYFWQHKRWKTRPPQELPPSV
ncbi:MAG: lysophospholipid acyltransferase family protein [Gemmatimonadota bacterium]